MLSVLALVNDLLPERGCSRRELGDAPEDLDTLPEECSCIQDAVSRLRLLLGVDQVRPVTEIRFIFVFS